MRLYDTRRQRVEPFEVKDNHVRLYVCGVTPYDTTHMGHAFTMMTFDLLTRYLEYQGERVTYVQNVTDIDDSILGKAKEINVPWDELGREQTEQYLRDLRNLNARMPDHYVRATDEMAKIIEINQQLVRDGWAYVSQGSVFYDVRKDPGFGQLSHYNYPQMLEIANERGNFPDDPRKRDPLDFVLWQAWQPGEPKWDSPWGPGRPGWHIECSAMSMSYLGPQLDVHGGGSDLVFPHHEAEIAQSEHYSGVTPFTRFWVHSAMVGLNGTKMSKSLGNLVMARRELEDHTSDALRLYLFSHHYRTPWDYVPDDVAAFDEAAHRLREAATLTPGHAGGELIDLDSYRAAFTAALDDDLDAPTAVDTLRRLGDAILLHRASSHVGDAQQLLRELGAVLGLKLGG